MKDIIKAVLIAISGILAITASILLIPVACDPADTPEPQPYWVTLPECEDTTLPVEACVMFDQDTTGVDTWFWYPRGMVGTPERLPAGSFLVRQDARIDLNLGVVIK